MMETRRMKIATDLVVTDGGEGRALLHGRCMNCGVRRTMVMDWEHVERLAREFEPDCMVGLSDDEKTFVHEGLCPSCMVALGLADEPVEAASRDSAKVLVYTALATLAMWM